MRPHVVLLLLLAPSAHATEEVGLRVLFGVGGALSAEDLERPGNPAITPPEEELQSEIGLELRLDTEISPDLWVGARFAWISAMGAEGGELSAWEGGMAARLLFPQESLGLYAELGVGLTALEVDDVLERTETFDGVGWHLVLGGGLRVPLIDTWQATLGMVWHRQSVDLRAQVDPAPALVGAVINRLLLSAGVAF